jgi:hypothetical protein
VFQGAVSKELICHDGTAQGLVISPHIFNFFCSDFPEPAEVNELYADNFAECESSPDITTLGPHLTKNLTHVTKWYEDNKLNIAAKNLSVTLFTP